MASEAGSGARPEAEERSSGPGRIPYQLRIGVTGHRKLPEDNGLRRAVRDAIDIAIGKSEYPKTGQNTPLRLVVVSALAEGADRRVAEEVLQCGAKEKEEDRESKLVCVLPVAEKNIDTYRADFESEDSQREFDKLLGCAWRVIGAPEDLVPAGATKEQRDAGYLWAGQEVIRNSDVVIAIWDGQPSRGMGGTADLVQRMRDHDDVGRSPADPLPLIGPRPAHGVVASTLFGQPVPDEPGLGAIGPLRIIVSTNADHTPAVDDGPLWSAAAAATEERLKGDLAGLNEFNSKHFDATRWQSSEEQTVNDLVPARYRQWPRLKHILEQITPPLNRADQAAMAAQRAFLWYSYAFFGFTALATIVAALQAVVFPGAWGLTVGELFLILASVGIVAAERVWKNNNKHWFVYRFLAERLRSSFYLLAVGCTPDTDFDIGGTTEEPTHNDWVRRAFTGVMDACVARQSEIYEDPETLTSLIRDHWIDGQIRYFDQASRKLMRQHRMVRRLLYCVLCATIVAALLHALRIWTFHSGNTQALVMCAIGLPAAAAALSNVRSIREFSRHSFRYARMATVMRRYIEKFENEPNNENLRKLAKDVDGLLTAETSGWLVEVSARGLEPG